MDQFVIKLYRWDRDPDPARDHNYGAEIDAIIDDLVGGADRLARGEWSSNPSARVAGTAITIILHEDGPELRFEPLPGYPDVDPPQLWPLATTWMASPTTNLGWERQVRVEYGGHRYEGRPANLQQFAQILAFFQALDPASPPLTAEP